MLVLSMPYKYSSTTTTATTVIQSIMLCFLLLYNPFIVLCVLDGLQVCFTARHVGNAPVSCTCLTVCR